MEETDSKTQEEGMHPSSSLMARWDQGLLCLVLLAMLGMIAYLLWPQPQAALTLTPWQPNQEITNVVENFPETTTLGAESEPADAPASSQARKHWGAAKKPAKPPVLNLNTATVHQLELLPGIGPKMAQRIIDYRKAHGPFKDAAQVMDVKGIGSKKFEKLKPYLKL